MNGRETFIADFIRELKIRHYSYRTVQAYTVAINAFADFAGAEFLLPNVDLIKDFLLLKKEQNWSPKTANIALCAIKFFCREILQISLQIDIKFAKRPSKIPVVLSHQEIVEIIRTLQNLKHRLMVSLAYAAGLRVSEVTKLKVADLNLNENIIYIRGAKGNKDRISIFPDKLKEEMEEFILNKSPNDYLFTNNRLSNRRTSSLVDGQIGNGGPERGHCYGKLNTRTLQKIFKNALERAKISSPATFHSLRHSFATHLLEGGTDIRFVQELLGHNSIRTTQIYTQVTTSALKRVVSPF